ncbi:DUF5686 family protein [Ferruginibacter sp.]|uniref:DUF5686 family protein n=1 Tax=Ferruginibacter sp. TaxID=1940288 RepID=UPI00374D3CEC
MLKIAIFSFLTAICSTASAQTGYVISGRIAEAGTEKPIPNATIHLKGSNSSTLSKIDGSFKLNTSEWYDSLSISSVGFSPFSVALIHNHTSGITISMQTKPGELQAVVIAASKRPGKSFMQKVIEQKSNNNPDRFRSYSYQRYTRNELDIDNIDFQKSKGIGLKSLMLKTYAGVDTIAKYDKELPIYFAERLANNYHSVSPNIDRENIIAKKNLGLKTDGLLSKLDKFYFNFNVYDEWLPIFDQTYVSPLNSNAFNYYNFFEGNKMVDEGDTLQQIRFTPMRSYERAFTGTLWINTKTFAVTTVNMHLNKTANLNFVNDINYYEDYKQVYDSTSDKTVYMPSKFSSEVKFESGLALLGLPIPENKNSIKFFVKNTTVFNKIKINTNEPATSISNLIKKEQIYDWDKSEAFWVQNRPDSLTNHEKNIYKMVDSLKQNDRFQRDIKLIAFAGTGFWDFGNKLRLGSYTSFISHNSIEGWRIRTGFWTMPGISKSVNLFGYGAYGTKDQKIKGMVGFKYIWNEARWTKTTISYASDYDFIIDQEDELDKDNIFNSLLRKNIPFTRTYTKQAMIKHDQYLSPDFTARASLIYKELSPVFDFKYRPINPAIDKPYDSVFEKKLPVAETSVGFRYAHKERTKMLNYDNIKLGTFSPVVTASFTYGFEQGKAQFNFQKINLSIEQQLRLPPKMMLYYKVEAGKTFGTIPYLLLNIPSGNEYYAASKYQYNTMAPYEFATDRYISLHTRFYLGGALFDKIPLLQKLGWRERFSFNAYWGDMSKANIEYNKSSNFNLIGSAPFMEASVGIGNIFHVLSIEYYRRLNYLNNPYSKRDGIYLGLTVAF